MPYGTDRVNVQSAGFNPSYKFTDQESDPESNLMNYDARYFNQSIGRFTQSDPLVLKITSNEDVKQITGQSQQQLLSNPQVFNSYAYVANNPLKYVDPDGQFLFLLPFVPYIFTASIAAIASYSAWELGQTAGYALEGDHVNSQIHSARNQLAFAGAATLGAGALTVMPYTVSSPVKGNLVVNESARNVSVSNGSNIRFSQPSMKTNFSSGPDVPKFFQNRSIDAVANDIKANPSLASQVQINYIERNGYKIIDNTRSAVALQKAGINPSQWNWNKLTDPQRISNLENRLSTYNIPTGITTINY